MDDSLYQTPGSECAAIESRSAAGKVVAIIGTVLIAGVPVSLVLTAIQLVQAYAGIAVHGGDDPRYLLEVMSAALVPLVVGTLVCVPGIICLIVSVVLLRYRSVWVYRVSLSSGLLGFFLFPIGTLLSVVLLISLVKNRKQFYVMSERDESASLLREPT